MCNLQSNYVLSKLVVRDLESAVSFYKTVFGLEEVARIDAELGGKAVSDVVLTRDGSQPPLVLFSYTGGDQVAVGESMVVFFTPDVVGVAAAAERAGARIVHAPHEVNSAGAMMKVAIVNDPEGHIIELVQAL